MSDDVYENNVYSLKEKMWHSKGTVGLINECAKDVYGRMKPVEFFQYPFVANIDGKEFPSKLYGIFRKEGEKVIEIGECKGRYRIAQPANYVEAFDSYCGKPVETMGFLGSSKADKLFITWVLPQIDVYGNLINMFGFITMGFDGKYGEHLYVTSDRIVCRNTFNFGIRDAIATQNHGYGINGNNGAIYSGKHTRDDHVERFGYWMRYIDQDAEKTVELMKNMFCKMEEKPITIDEAFGLFSNVFPYPNDKSIFCPPELVNEKKEDYNTKVLKADEDRDLAMDLFKGAGIEITNTVFGAFNCITEMQNHHIDSRKNDGTESILIGNRQVVMSRAFNLMSEYAIK